MYHGVLRIYKEKGYTSHDVVGKLRGILKQKKIGHTGTLDPDAEGVLPVCLGSATKLCDMLTDSDKTYETICKLGIETDTQDLSGTVLKTSDTGFVTEEQIRSAIREFIGDYEQVPPMYSALKVNGKKLYEYAREGIEIERKSRHVTIYSIQIKKTDLECMEITMEVHCSKGTYIRTLCHDLGKKLGCGGCMKQLLRTKAAGFSILECKTLEEIKQCVLENQLMELLIPVDEMFACYPACRVVSEEGMKRLTNGNLLLKKHLTSYEIMPKKDMPFGKVNLNSWFRVYDSHGIFQAVYEEKNGQFVPVKTFFQ